MVSVRPCDLCVSAWLLSRRSRLPVRHASQRDTQRRRGHGGAELVSLRPCDLCVSAWIVFRRLRLPARHASQRDTQRRRGHGGAELVSLRLCDLCVSAWLVSDAHGCAADTRLNETRRDAEATEAQNWFLCVPVLSASLRGLFRRSRLRARHASLRGLFPDVSVRCRARASATRRSASRQPPRQELPLRSVSGRPRTTRSTTPTATPTAAPVCARR